MSAFAVQLSKGCLPSDIEPEDQEAFALLQELGALEQTPSGLYRLNSLYRVGRFSIDKEGNGYVEAELKEQRDLLIFSEHFGGARHGDFVVAKRFMAARGRPSGKIVAVIKRAKLYTIAYTSRTEEGVVLVDIKTGESVDGKMDGVPLTSFKTGTVFKLDADSGEVLEVLGNLDDPKVDEKIALAIYHRRDAFPKACIAEAKAVESEVTVHKHPGRVDLRRLDFCTIDPVTAKDFDDAIYFDTKSSTLFVAIADVSHYVPYFCEIDKEAKKRGFTTYFPHRAVPMLPRELSENICSLKPKVDRLAFVCEIKLDPKTLQPLEERFYEAIIHSKHRFNYDAVDRLIAEGLPEDCDETVARLWRFLKPLYGVTQRLRRARLTKGFDFRSEEIKLTLDKSHRLQSTQIETGTPSHSLIEECMLLANKAAAKRFSGEGDGIFRIHEPPELSKIEALLVELAKVGIFVEEYDDAPDLIRAIQREAKKAGLENEVDALLIKSLKQASYSAYNVGHFGLGFAHYSHFTSPIRRYSDLILHRLIKAQLRHDEEEKAYLLRNIDPLCVRVSALERESTKCEWDFRDRKFARWASEHLDETFEAEIVEIDGEQGAAKAELRDANAPAGIVVQVRTDGEMLFDRVLVRLSEAHIAQTVIVGEIVGKRERES